MSLQQVLYNHIQNIASMYPPEVRQRYVDAAVTFRMPYWDWALTPPSGESVLPGSLQELNVLVDGPVGAQTIGNPLYSYDFHPLNPDDIPNFPVRRLPPGLPTNPLTDPDKPVHLHHPLSHLQQLQLNLSKQRSSQRSRLQPPLHPAAPL